MKNFKTFLIAFFVTIFSVTSFSQTTHNIDFRLDQDQDSTISIRRGDSVNFINKTGSTYTFIVNDVVKEYSDSPNEIIKNIECLDDVVIIVKMNNGAFWCTYKLTVNINTLGTNDLSDINFNIFPNPTTDFLNITGDNIKNIKVIDMNGRVLFNEDNTSSDIKVDVTSFTKGNYMVRVNDTKSIRFVKN